MFRFNDRIDQFLGDWIDHAIRYRWWITISTLLIVAFAFAYTAENLRFNTDTRDMLSKKLEWRQLDLAYEKIFPMYVDEVLVVIEAETPDQASDAARALIGELQQEQEFYREIFHPAGLEFLQQSSLLYMDTDELHDLSDRLANIQPFLGQLVQDQTLRGLFGLIEDAIQARRDGEVIDLGPMLEQVTAVTSNRLEDPDIQPGFLSWQNLIAGETKSRDVYREYLFIQPVIDFTNLLPGETAINAIRQTIHSMGDEALAHSDIRLTGSATLAYEEIKNVSRGAGIAALLAMLIVTIILIAGLRSVRLIIASLITLITGLILTAAMATATVGELNLISVAFAVLYIGLGVDFAIHFCLRFRELHFKEEVATALRNTGSSVGRSLGLCALTTAIGLYAFMPTEYRGIAELGWISGTGMFISLIVTLTLLPALLAIFPPRRGNRLITDKTDILLDRIAALPVRYARGITLGALLLAIMAALTLPALRFDPNTLNLQDPNIESVQTYRDLLADSEDSPWSGILILQGEQDMRDMTDRLATLERVDSVRTIQDFIPADQDDKLFIIDDMNFLLGGTLSGDRDDTVATAEDRQAALNRLLTYLAENPPQTDETRLLELQQLLAAYQQQLQSLDTAAGAASLQAYEQSLLRNLPGRFDALAASLNARPIGMNDIPEMLLRRWVGPDDWYRVEILPRDNLNDEKAMRAFVDEVRTEAPNLIGAAVIQLEAGDAVVKAFIEAFALALTAITLFLLLLLRSLRDTLLALAPLLLAALLTAATTVVLDVPFNFANIIALPLLLGIGIDNSIHMLQRHRTAPPAHGLLLRTSTARAVLVSALTTICSIGNLAFSSHAGTASMGLLLTIGITFSLLCALILLPGLLNLKK